LMTLSVDFDSVFIHTVSHFTLKCIKTNAV
jgi:hypothetical protein